MYISGLLWSNKYVSLAVIFPLKHEFLLGGLFQNGNLVLFLFFFSHPEPSPIDDTSVRVQIAKGVFSQGTDLEF